MIPNREGWHYLPVKGLLTLFIGINLKNNRDFFLIVFIPSEQ